MSAVVHPETVLPSAPGNGNLEASDRPNRLIGRFTSSVRAEPGTEEEDDNKDDNNEENQTGQDVGEEDDEVQK